MGYRAGEGIGAARQGRAEPLAVDLKASRAGLGIDEDKRRRKERAVSQQVEKGGAQELPELQSFIWNRIPLTQYLEVDKGVE